MQSPVFNLLRTAALVIGAIMLLAGIWQIVAPFFGGEPNDAGRLVPCGLAFFGFFILMFGIFGKGVLPD